MCVGGSGALSERKAHVKWHCMRMFSQLGGWSQDLPDPLIALPLNLILTCNSYKQIYIWYPSIFNKQKILLSTCTRQVRGGGKKPDIVQ